MKRSALFLFACAFLTFFLMTMSGTTVEADDSFTLLKWEDVELRVLDFKMDDIGNPVNLMVNVRAINNSGYNLWFKIDDARADSTPITSAGRSCEAYTDTGTDNPLHFSFFTEDIESDAQNEALRTARTIDMNISLVDEANYHTLYTTHVSFDLINSRAKTPGGLEYTSASDYQLLTYGDYGEAVSQLQQRLIDLGYLDYAADGSYGEMTNLAVRAFCEQNGLHVYNEASPEMQALLYSTDAKPFNEAWFPLIIGSQFSWEAVPEVNTFFFKVLVTNTSKDRTIRGFETKCYVTDIWGERIADDPIYSQVTAANIAPGESAYCSSFNLGHYASVYTVWVGISKIVFDDGEVRELDDVDYYECIIEK